jgi:hypothetical protein
MQVAAARDDQVRENRLRRAAERQGRTLTKSKLRDPDAKGYGTYSVSEGYYGAGGDGVTLDEAESLLIGEAKSEAMDRFQEVASLWGRVSGDISLRARESRFMDIEVPVVELGYLAQELETGGMDTLTVMVRFFEEDLKAITDWLEWTVWRKD